MNSIIETIKNLSKQLDSNQHRCCLVAAGSEVWTREIADQILDQFPEKTIHWVSKKAPDIADKRANIIDPTKIQTILGEETDIVIFDARSGFNPDTFGAVAGLIRGGGFLLLLTPELSEWGNFLDPEYKRITVYPITPEEMSGRFLIRITKVLREHQDTIIFEQDQPIPTFSLSDPFQEKSNDQKLIDPIFKTEDQKQAVEAIIKVAKGRRNRPLVITSDRGRGKSAALGIAAAELIKNDLEQIIVTAPRLDATNILFDHAADLLFNKEVSRGQIKTENSVLKFMAPDELLRSDQKANLLLIDEAAAIPAPILEQLLIRFSRVVFATTVHGYEGTGRGFAVRFQKTLDELTPSWKALEMKMPIRWAENDPLEDLVFRSLLLDAKPASDNLIKNIRLEDCEIKLIDRDALLKDENLLQQIFGLLINAHYQTRPTDLRYLLDGPNLSIFVMQKDDQIIATALLAKEGGFDQKLAAEITSGKRRPHGHLIPETLASHIGLKQAPLLTGARVVRIAVHAALRNKGFGTKLLDSIKKHPSISGLDYMGSCFGATTELLQFWEKSDYQHVRIGVQRNASSGEHSVVVLNPLSEKGKELFALAQQRFYKQFPHQLFDSLSDLETELVAFLLKQDQIKPNQIIQEQKVKPKLDEMDWEDINAFIKNERIYESCSASIWDLTYASFMDEEKIKLLNSDQKEVLIKKVLQKKSWKEVSDIGKKTILKNLREVLNILIV